MPNIDPPQIIKLLAEAPFFEHVPYLDPNEAVILYFKNHPESLHYQAFQFKKDQLTALNEMKPFNDSPYESAFLGENDLSIPLSDIPKGEVLSCWEDANAQEIQFLPIVLLSGPVAAILIPRPQQEEHLTDLYQQYLPMLGGIARECCLREISEKLPPVTSEESVEDLLYFYSKALVEWLFPYQFSIFKNDTETLLHEKIYRGRISTHKDWFEFKLHLDEGVYTLRFEIPSLRYPIKGQPDWWHEVGHFKLRKFKYRMLFATLFDIIYKLRKTTQSNHLTIQEQLRHVEALLKQIKLDYTQSTPTQVVPKMPKQRKLDDFCFFREKNNWIIQFMGRSIRPNIKSPQGMESIRLLLENSSRRLRPLELYDLLEKGEFTYGRGRQQTGQPDSGEEQEAIGELMQGKHFHTTDPLRDEALIDEDKKTYQQLSDMELDTPNYSEKEQLQLLAIPPCNGKSPPQTFSQKPSIFT
jgi:hypothetical protein